MSDSKPPVPAGERREVERGQSDKAAVTHFVRQARALAAAKGQSDGRLVLAIDATMSRQPTWDLACQLQADMFDAAAGAGKLAIQLVYFRGLGECRASRFVGDAAALKSLMVRIDCRAGHTQVGKVLSHALKENEQGRIGALVYIGDAMEEEIDQLAQKAGELGIRGVPAFIFQEGRDPTAERAFREIARLTKGAWFRFDRSSADTLKRLLSAVAVFAAGGLKALEARGTAEDRLMITSLKGAGRK